MEVGKTRDIERISKTFGGSGGTMEPTCIQASSFCVCLSFPSYLGAGPVPERVDFLCFDWPGFLALCFSNFLAGPAPWSHFSKFLSCPAVWSHFCKPSDWLGCLVLCFRLVSWPGCLVLAFLCSTGPAVGPVLFPCSPMFVLIAHMFCSIFLFVS